MTDFFALFGEERRPWLEAERLKGKYHELTSRHHPDVTGETGDFAEINRGYQTLADPGARLRHLMELEAPGGVSRSQTVPEDVAGFFGAVAETSGRVDGFLKRYAAAASPVAKAVLAAEQYRVQEEVEGIIARLQEKQEELIGRVREVDGIWSTNRAAALRALSGIWHSLGYVGKWLGTLREGLFRLAGL